MVKVVDPTIYRQRQVVLIAVSQEQGQVTNPEAVHVCVSQFIVRTHNYTHGRRLLKHAMYI